MPPGGTLHRSASGTTASCLATSLANPRNEHVPVRVGESMIDYENAFASLTEVSRIVYNQPLPDDFFQLNRIVAPDR